MNRRLFNKSLFGFLLFPTLTKADKSESWKTIYVPKGKDCEINNVYVPRFLLKPTDDFNQFLEWHKQSDKVCQAFKIVFPETNEYGFMTVNHNNHCEICFVPKWNPIYVPYPTSVKLRKYNV